MVAAEKAEKLQMAKNKEKLIDDLMFSEGDADAIVADHQTKIAQVRQLLPLLFVFLIHPTGQRLKSPPPEDFFCLSMHHGLLSYKTSRFLMYCRM